jgi:hypothetical protein
MALVGGNSPFSSEKRLVLDDEEMDPALAGTVAVATTETQSGSGGDAAAEMASSSSAVKEDKDALASDLLGDALDNVFKDDVSIQPRTAVHVHKL